MKRKLKRSHRSVFGRRGMPPALKTLLWIVICVSVVALGYFGAKLTSEGRRPQPDLQVSGSDTTPSQPQSGTENPDVPADQPSTPADVANIRAFYLPTSALSVDSLTDTSLLQEAKAAGFNAVLFDLKDAEGTLYYTFSCPQAKKVNAYAPGALTADQLTALFSLIREAGLQPIPRLYAFRDNLGGKALTDARISHVDNHGWSWLDAAADKGGRRWLNPYSDAAHAYVGALADELKEMGAAAIMLDGVEFPHQLKDAYLGEDASTMDKGDALTAFVAKMRSRLGEDCPVLLGCTAESALGNDTKCYGGNPLTFGATFASPALTNEVQASVEKMILRTQVLESKPDLVPMLMMDTVTVKEANAAIAACIAGGADSFILVPPAGNYDFSGYDLLP